MPVSSLGPHHSSQENLSVGYLSHNSKKLLGRAVRRISGALGKRDLGLQRVADVHCFPEQVHELTPVPVRGVP